MKTILAFLAGASLALVPTATASLTGPSLSERQQTRAICRIALETLPISKVPRPCLATARTARP